MLIMHCGASHFYSSSSLFIMETRLVLLSRAVCLIESTTLKRHFEIRFRTLYKCWSVVATLKVRISLQGSVRSLKARQICRYLQVCMMARGAPSPISVYFFTYKSFLTILVSDLVWRVLGVYEMLRQFASMLALTPFLLEDFCHALTSVCQPTIC